jgi:DNA invertase Pin-like site-specific DNA recombinase
MVSPRDSHVNSPSPTHHKPVMSGPSGVKRPPISPQLVAKVRELFTQGADTTEISKMLKASEALVYNALGRTQP